MIDLTPLDVRKKKEDFRKAVRGYDPSQVNAFLDVVADRVEQLASENRAFKERASHLEEQLSYYRERERALNEALLAAQELREEARSQAERDAAVKLREAETHAEAILLEADQAIRHSQRRLKEIRAQRAHLLRALRAVVHRFAESLELEESRLEQEPEELDDLLDKLERDLSAAGGSEPPGGAGGPVGEGREGTATGEPRGPQVRSASGGGEGG